MSYINANHCSHASFCVLFDNFPFDSSNNFRNQSVLWKCKRKTEHIAQRSFFFNNMNCFSFQIDVIQNKTKPNTTIYYVNFIQTLSHCKCHGQKCSNSFHKNLHRIFPCEFSLHQNKRNANQNKHNVKINNSPRRQMRFLFASEMPLHSW